MLTRSRGQQLSEYLKQAEELQKAAAIEMELANHELATTLLKMAQDVLEQAAHIGQP